MESAFGVDVHHYVHLDGSLVQALNQMSERIQTVSDELQALKDEIADSNAKMAAAVDKMASAIAVMDTAAGIIQNFKPQLDAAVAQAMAQGGDPTVFNDLRTQLDSASTNLATTSQSMQDHMNTLQSTIGASSATGTSAGTTPTATTSPNPDQSASGGVEVPV